MLNVDISNIWCSVTLSDLLAQEPVVAKAHAGLVDVPGADFLNWLGDDTARLFERMEEAARRIRDESEYLIVVGSDSAVLGAQALLELLRGRAHALRGGLKVLFAGSDLSTHAWQRLMELLEGRDFCVHAVGRDGMALEPALALRSLRWALERRYGSDKARERLFLSTDPSRGALRRLALQEGCMSFVLPRTLAGHASVLAPSVLLGPLACGVDVKAVLDGAAAARREMEIRSFENPAWLYAAARTILAKRGRKVEYLSTAEPDAWTLCRWWQDLFGGRWYGKGRALIPVAAEIPADLRQMHGLLAGGKLPVMQTILRFTPPPRRQQVEMDLSDYDDLNCLDGYTLDYLQERTIEGALQAGADGDVPIVTVDCGALDARGAGQLCYFFELASCLSAGMAGHEPYSADPPARFAEEAGKLLGRGASEKG